MLRFHIPNLLSPLVRMCDGLGAIRLDCEAREDNNQARLGGQKSLLSHPFGYARFAIGVFDKNGLPV